MVFERLPEFDESHGPKRFSLIYICGDGVATYQALYWTHGIAPRAVAIIQPGTGFGGNWTDFFMKSDPLYWTVKNNPAGLPEYVYCGYWSQSATPATTNPEHMQLHFDWPEYQFMAPAVGYPQHEVIIFRQEGLKKPLCHLYASTTINKTIIMKNINTKDDFKHPEEKIQLLNGTVLDCYPLEQPMDKVENDLKLDTSGNYLVVDEKKKIVTFPSLYENFQIVLGKPTIFAEKITHFSAGGLGACAYSDDISIGELAKCWQHEEYHIKCLHCGEVAYITQWAGHATSGGYWQIKAYCPHCGKEYHYERHTASLACNVHWTTMKNILQEERKAILFTGEEIIHPLKPKKL